jgi:hypothetical protein
VDARRLATGDLRRRQLHRGTRRRRAPAGVGRPLRRLLRHDEGERRESRSRRTQQPHLRQRRAVGAGSSPTCGPATSC